MLARNIATCYWPSSQRIPGQKFVTFAVELNRNRAKSVCAITTPLHSLYGLDRESQPSMRVSLLEAACSTVYFLRTIWY